MYDVVKAKFSQNKKLKQRLLNTGDKHLEEGNTWGIKFGVQLMVKGKIIQEKY